MWLTTVMEVLFAGAVLSLVADFGAKRYGARRGLVIGLISAVVIALSLAIVLIFWPATTVGYTAVQPLSSLLASLYVIDRFSVFTAFAVLVVGLIASVYSMRYLRSTDNQGPFYALLLLLMGSLVGVISAGDYLSLFLFWEGMSVSAYALVSYSRSQLSLEASIKYFFMAGVGSLIALYGIAVIYSVTGSLQLAALGGFIASGSQLATFGLAMLIIGLGVEAAMVPLHTWLPDVYATSPLPVASVISGAVTGASVFAILKVVQPLVPNGDFGGLVLAAQSNVHMLQALIGSLALITMFVGNLSALHQTNLRRILAFSSVAQTGYMLAALATLSVPGLVAVVFTIWNHGLLKSNFFMLIGKENSAYEDAELEKLAGAGRKDRPLGFLYASSSLAMMGAPPFGMFWSEILVVLALVSVQSGPSFWLAIAVVGNILLSIGYYFKIINTVVFGKSEGPSSARPLVDLLPSMLLLSLSLLTGLVPFLLLNHLVI
jgi:proton-translocating NADH-quinone oxidoreductase chain N